MTVEIPAELQPFVDQIIHSGSYNSEAEVVGGALRLLQERQRRVEELRREIQPALDQLNRGEGIELNTEEELRLFFEDIKNRGQQRLQAEQAG
ncbi:MAG: type II toxin-antitoxin system ParD family antitoxin [Planctomycetaceae bacterium]|nr:type II toxin-antitoxin system ParD family antitoxin [Planctomycetaceae bacterium]